MKDGSVKQKHFSDNLIEDDIEVDIRFLKRSYEICNRPIDLSRYSPQEDLSTYLCRKTMDLEN